jgi:protein gp37
MNGAGDGDFGLSRPREGFCVRKDGDTWFSPRMRADMSAALVETEENWKVRPGNSFKVMPPGETSSTVPAISSTGAVKCLSSMRMTDSRVFLTRLRIFSYSISSSVLPYAAFVNSMSDLFHEEVPDRYIVAAFEVMAATDWHTYQILTKRPERMRRMLENDLEFAARLPHIWWGVTVENKQHGLRRLECLQDCGVAMRFLSCEPLLEDLGTVCLDGINWVIGGGESGPGARPVRRDWIVSIRDQCESADVPFYFKQWGGFPKGKRGCELDGKECKALPPMPILQAPSLGRRRQNEGELRKQFWAMGILDKAA